MNEDRTMAAVLASTFAREIGLPPGNFWEPAVSPSIYRDVRSLGAAAAETQWRMRLDLPERRP